MWFLIGGLVSLTEITTLDVFLDISGHLFPVVGVLQVGKGFLVTKMCKVGIMIFVDDESANFSVWGDVEFVILEEQSIFFCQVWFDG